MVIRFQSLFSMSQKFQQGFLLCNYLQKLTIPTNLYLCETLKKSLLVLQRFTGERGKGGKCKGCTFWYHCQSNLVCKLLVLQPKEHEHRCASCPLTTAQLHASQYHLSSFLGCGFPHGHHPWRTDEFSHRNRPRTAIASWLVLFRSCHQSCSALGFDLLRSHKFEQDRASPVWMGVLQGKHRCTRKWFDDSKLTKFPPQVQTQSLLKTGDFFSP